MKNIIKVSCESLEFYSKVMKSNKWKKISISSLIKSFLSIAILICCYTSSFSRVPADTNWRNVFNEVWRAWPAPNLVFVDSSGMYIGGSTIISEDTLRGLAKWDGTKWSALRDSKGIDGTNGIPYCLTGGNNFIFVAGLFDSAGSVPARNIAFWDGFNWHSLGSGINGYVSAIAVRNGILYAGGNFDSAGSVRALNIAKWDGSSWSALGNGLYGYRDENSEDVSTVNAITFDSNGNLYAGGSFDSAGTIKVNNIAVWNDTAWASLGLGIEGDQSSSSFLNSLAYCNNFLYAGGDFYTAGGDSIYGIARWNGTVWSTLGGLKDEYDNSAGIFNSFSVSGNDVYVAGSFTQIDTVQVNNIARWRNEQWEPLGSGIGSSASHWVDGISTYNNVLIAVGFFMSTGDTIFSPHFGFWCENPIPEPMFSDVVHQQTAITISSIVYPNPSSQVIKIKYSIQESGTDIVSIIDSKGVAIKELYSGMQEAGEHEYSWDSASFTNGLYFCIVTHNGKRLYQKIIISK